MTWKNEEECYLLLPYEVIDKLGATGDVSTYTSLPANSPFGDAKAAWVTEFWIPWDGSDVAVCGLWGDAAPFHTRDSIMMLLFNVISGVCNMRRWIATWSKRMACASGGARLTQCFDASFGWQPRG